MRISDWSSDVCSSDLDQQRSLRILLDKRHYQVGASQQAFGLVSHLDRIVLALQELPGDIHPQASPFLALARIERLEDVGHVIGPDSWPVVGEHHEPAITIKQDLDLARRWCTLEPIQRVVEQDRKSTRLK